jgi:hypothetical protein
MKLNITNYNPNYESDSMAIDDLIKIFVDIKENLNKKDYIIYNLFLNKITKFINFINNNDKEIKEYQQQQHNNIFDYDTSKEDDEVNSIASISEYEDDENQLEEDNILIDEFEEETEKYYIFCDERFDFDFENIYL